jgi:hypothetical protein
MQPPNISGPTQNAGLLQSDPINAAMQLGAVPGREGLAQQGIAQAAAMQRQLQAQQHAASNLSMRDRLTLDRQHQDSMWRRDAAIMKHNQTGAYQAGQLGIAQQNADTNLGGLQLRYNQDQRAQQLKQFKAQYPGAGLEGQAQIDYQNVGNKYHSAANVLTDTIDLLQKAPTGGIVLNPAKAMALKNELVTSVVPTLQQEYNSGVLNEGELEHFVDIIGDPTAPHKLRSVAQAKLKSLLELVKQRGSEHYSYSGRGFEPKGLGHSFTMRGLSNQSINPDDYVPRARK